MYIRRAVIAATLALGFAGMALMGSVASAGAAASASGTASHTVIAAQAAGVYYRG
jgi:hypothetical protein